MKRLLSGISPEQFEKIKRELNQQLGVTIASNDGVIDEKGFQVQYRYNPAQMEFSIALLKKPWFVPGKVIEQKIDEWLERSGPSYLGPNVSVRKLEDD